MSLNVEKVAEYVLAYCTEKGKAISNLQLQKFLYYIQGYSFRWVSSAAFEEDLYHWTYGPVSPDAYYKYCVNVRNPIEVDLSILEENPVSLDKELKEIIKKVSDKCLLIPSSELVSRSHNEIPWKTTKSSSVIPKQKIKYFFSENDPLNIER